jgi:hypothetical protein
MQAVKCEFESYRDEIARLLELAQEQLPERECERIRIAVKQRHVEYAARYLARTRAESLGGRLIDLLTEAEKDLAPEQVRELELLIESTLPNLP